MCSMNVLGIEKSAMRLYIRPRELRGSFPEVVYVSTVGSELKMRNMLRRIYKDSMSHHYNCREARAIVMSNLVSNPFFVIRKPIEV